MILIARASPHQHINEKKSNLAIKYVDGITTVTEKKLASSNSTGLLCHYQNVRSLRNKVNCDSEYMILFVWLRLGYLMISTVPNIFHKISIMYTHQCNRNFKQNRLTHGGRILVAIKHINMSEKLN